MIAKYYRDRNGVAPVAAYMDALPKVARIILNRQIARLNGLSETDPDPRFPYSSQVQGDMRELRCHVGSMLYRILYRRSRAFFVLLHMFQKQTKKIPKADIEVAESRWHDFKTRMDVLPRLGLRPLGADAP